MFSDVQRNLFICVGSRAKRMGAFEEKALPNPVGSDCQNAFYVVKLAQSDLISCEADYKDWLAHMRMMGNKFGDLVIHDPFSDAA